MTCNGWTNKETWLVNVWYMDSMPEYFADMDQFHVDANELAETIQGIVEECEALSQLPAGLLSDFINDSWREVNWHELAESLNQTLADMAPEEAESDAV
jgi:rhamnogalacturonyl hydrolase YesR